MCIGLASHSKSGFILDIIEHLINENNDSGTSFEVVVINWRGLSGMKLQTPTFYCGSSTSDLLEPMEYVYEKYCKPYNRKAFAVGCSMGGNVLVNSLGLLGS
jgi:predicted alpha/beta-fold hydrolase